MSARMPMWLRQLGWPGLVGAALLLGCAWFIQVDLPRQRDAVAQAESGAVAAQPLVFRDPKESRRLSTEAAGLPAA